MTRTPLQVTLPVLLGKCLDAGWEVLVRAPNPDSALRLDEMLWLRPEDGFLPHGLATGGAEDAEHPILLSGDGAAPSGRAAVACIEGAPLAAAEVEDAERAMILFDGQDPAAVEHARGQWRTLTEAGCAAQYWSEASGKWEMKAESGG